MERKLADEPSRITAWREADIPSLEHELLAGAASSAALPSPPSVAPERRTARARRGHDTQIRL